MEWWELIGLILLCEGVGLLGGRWTGPEIPRWYRTLAKPSFNPPGWIFAPVWAILYVLMAIAAWLVIESPASPARTVGLILFFIQLALNLAWSWIFFRKHAIGAAAIEVAVLWCTIGVATVLFSQVSGAAAWLMAPYWAWVTFASILNAMIWRLNPARHDGLPSFGPQV
jgi:benzodiazapine receptor